MRPVSVASRLLVVSLAILSPGLAQAGCNEEKVVNIAIPAGRSCWVYRGDATVFVGEFGGGQSVSARMSGESAEYDQATGKTFVRMGPRTPEVSGPRDFSTAGENGSMDFETPRAGVYRFSFSPCAMWGGAGVVEICAR